MMLASCLLSCLTSVMGTGVNGASLVPTPKHLELGDASHHKLRSLGCDSEEFLPQLRVFEQALAQLGAGRLELAGDEAELRFVQCPMKPGETYRIRSESETLIVEAQTPTGMAQAVSTLLQLVEVQDGVAVLPHLKLADGPDFPFRCFMVDMGRNPHSPETLRQVVDMLAFYKANYLQLHLGDDQLFSWPSKAYPKLLSERAGWTWADFEALETYSQARGVTIVPELDVPGHSTILRREYPEVFGKTTTDLASSAAAKEGIETLLGEMIEVFRASPYVHVGGDEAYGVPEELQRKLINHLDAFLRARGKRTIVWEGPQLGAGDNKVSTDVLHMNWRTINVSAQAMLDAGYEIINAAWDPLYIVDHYPRTMFTAVDLERCYLWNPQRFAHVNHDISTFGRPHVTKSHEGILGFCMPWWEGREENLLPLCLPRLAAVASAAWNRSGERDFEDFLLRQGRSLSRLESISGFHLPETPFADSASQVANRAFRGQVSVSSGAHQPHFGPDRLTNGITDRFDHFLGFATKPEPLEILIELPTACSISRVVVHETAVGESYERYELLVSGDGQGFESVGRSEQGTRGESSFVEHRFESRELRYLKIRTQGCHGLTFPSFSRLCEVMAFEE